MSPRIGARRLNIVLSLGVLLLGTLGGTFAVFQTAAQASVNLSCPQGTTEYKVDGNPLNGLSNGESAQFTVNGETFTFTKVVGPSPFEDDTFDFTSTIAVSVVYVKGGVDTNEYDYAPPATSGSGLHPPLNGGGEAPAISHVTFCVGGSGTTTTTVPETTTTVGDTTTTVGETTTTVGETTTTVPDETTTTVGETTTTVPDETTTTVGETTTTVPDETTTTVPDETTTTVDETTTTLGEQGSTTTVPEETTTTFGEQGSTTIFTTTSTQPQSTSTTPVTGEGGTIPTATTPVTVPGSLPRTGSGSAFAAMLGMSCVAAGMLLIARRRRSWSRP
jgi:LPXTG-motif cell wall-anchored protein